MELVNALGNERGRTSARRGFCLLLLTVMAVVGCADAPARRAAPDTRLAPIASSEPVPTTNAPTIALIERDRVCMVDSYNVQVMCGDRSWTDTTRIGGEGEGPGEWGGGLSLMRTSTGGIGVFDFALGRFTDLSVSGSVEQMISFPERVVLLTGATDGIMGAIVEPVITRHGPIRIRWFDLEDGLAHVDTLSNPREPESDALFGRGAVSAEGGVVLASNPYRLARYDPSGEPLDVFVPEHYVPELPSRIDVAKHERDMGSLFGTEPSAREMEEFEQTPKPGLIRGRPLRFAPNGTLWVGTTRDHHRRSYIDLFRGGDYLGRVSVADRLVAFDVSDEVLVCLVARWDDEGLDLPTYAIDWYDISGVVDRFP